MRVSDIMTPDPITVGPDSTLQEALDLMVRNEIRELPVLEDERVVGIITDRDLKMVLGPGARFSDESQLDEARLARDVSVAMTAEVETIYEDLPASEACRLLVELRVGALPVLDHQDRLVGILSATDLLSHAAALFEAEED